MAGRQKCTDKCKRNCKIPKSLKVSKVKVLKVFLKYNLKVLKAMGEDVCAVCPGINPGKVFL